MDQGELREIVRGAVALGVFDPTVMVKLEQECSIETGLVATSALLHTYRRRLRRTGGDDALLQETLKLVSFLQNYPEDYLSMVSVRPVGGGFYLILADSTESRALFWMKMFDQDC
ncbi:hypothetical protein ACH4UT_25880 [Streptomyces sp. NPDC020799]|uniref:hypothetical protein n=1 Tax=unclassified Streptomyces TaxID=2593676 RepID=UPI0033DE78B7